MADEAQTSWREQRHRAITAHAAAYERRSAIEAAQARELVAEFTRQALARGLRTTRLTGRAYHGRARYRTGLYGWYLNVTQSLAVSRASDYYILDVRPSLWARFTGVAVAPADPRLVIGVGARDGESITLQAMLQRRLAAGDDWPGTPPR